MNAFIACKNIGQVTDGVTIEYKRNTDGMYYYKATTVVRNIFGSDMGEGAPVLEAYGVTQEQARERLAEEERKFNDSLWF